MNVTEGRTVTGPAGTAVELVTDLDTNDPPDWTASLAGWFLTCPGQSPAWSHYGLSIIHLRPIDGVRPAHLRSPDATHEVILCAYDPAANPTTTDQTSWRQLLPINLMEQLVLPDDEAAVHLLELAARAVVAGMLWAEPPLSGQREPWRSALTATAAHARGEHT